MKLLQFPVKKLEDAQTILRNIADEIDAGKYGEIECCAIVVMGEELSVFSDSRMPDAHYTLCCGVAQLQQHVLGLGSKDDE